MEKTIILQKQYVQTWGSEICVTLYVTLRARIHTLVLQNSNFDGEWEVILRLRFATAKGFKKALEKIECDDFGLDYDFEELATRAKKLPIEFRSVVIKMQAARAHLDKPIKRGNHTITILSPKESRRRYGNSVIFVAPPPFPPEESAQKYGNSLVFVGSTVPSSNKPSTATPPVSDKVEEEYYRPPAGWTLEQARKLIAANPTKQ